MNSAVSFHEPCILKLLQYLVCKGAVIDSLSQISLTLKRGSHINARITRIA